MVVRLSPFPEELERGYLGRLMRINGFSNERVFIRYAATACNLQPSMPNKAIALVVLSTLAGKTTEEFARFHTLLPFRRAITNNRSEVPFGSLLHPSLLGAAITRARRRIIFFCTECALEDLEFHGDSYWRRDHQIAGQVWCPKHRVALNFVTKQFDVLNPPHSFQSRAGQVENSLVNEAIKNPAVNRFLDMAGGLMHRKKPLPGIDAAIEIRTEAEKRCLYIYRRKDTQGLMSDFVRSSYPVSWLKKIAPELAVKTPNSSFDPIDAVLGRKRQEWSPLSYLLIAAAVYESSDAAIEKLMSCEKRQLEEFEREIRLARYIAHESKKDKRIETLSISVDSVIEEYANVYGKRTSFARSLKISPAQASRIFSIVGLPNLAQRGLNRRLLAAAKALCFEGLTMAECSMKTNVSVEKLLAWNIKPGSTLMHALRLMIQQPTEEDRHSKAVRYVDALPLQGLMA